VRTQVISAYRVHRTPIFSYHITILATAPLIRSTGVPHGRHFDITWRALTSVYALQ